MAESRNQLIKLIHVAKRSLNMDESSYRHILQTIGGAASAADLSVPKLELVLEHLKKCGFTVRSNKKPQRKLADDQQSKMIRGLWLELANFGVVKDPSEQALASFVKRMTKVSALQWLSSKQASQVIENLKQWRDRTN